MAFKASDILDVLLVPLTLTTYRYDSCHFWTGNLRTLFDLHLGHTLSRTSCLGATGIMYSCPQWRHLNDRFIILFASSGL
jgi:hypothetical protein